MTQQYPPQPPPGYGPQAQPPKKKRGKGCLFGALGVLVVGVIAIAASTSGSKDGDTGSKVSGSKPPAHTAQKDSGKTDQNPVHAFQAYVTQHGTPNERSAVKHVTKVQGADSKNDVLDSAEVYTDFKGDMVSADASKGKLIASAFRDWEESRGKASKNGLVTVYNRSGAILSNGNY